jgi:uncharacterized membrane protein YphA (DoxX/SURF4 family)
LAPTASVAVAVGLTCRYAVASLLALAAIPKFADQETFRQSVSRYGLKPKSARMAVSAIPWIEVLSAVCLFVGLFPGPVALLDALVFLGFAGANGAAASGPDPTCGCFGAGGSSTLGWRLIALDTVGAAMAAAVPIAAGGRWLELFDSPGSQSAWPLAVVAVMAVLTYRLLDSWGALRAAIRLQVTVTR